jgi:hypothetical protein
MAWLSTVTKLAPLALELGKIAVSALPHLTRRKSDIAAATEDLPFRPDIAELQSAATQNAEDIRKIASDLRNALIAIEDGAKTIEARFQRLEGLAYAALAISIISAASTLALWLR